MKIRKIIGTKAVSFLLVGSMLPVTTACDDHEIAVGAAIIAAGAAISSSHNRDRRSHRRDDYRRSRRHYDRNHDHIRRDRDDRRSLRRASHFNNYFVNQATNKEVAFKSLKETASTLVKEATLQDYMTAYKLDKQGATILKAAVDQADKGYLEALEELGLTSKDIQDLQKTYRVNNAASIGELAKRLGQKVYETKSMLHLMAMYARDLRLEACETDSDHFDAICN